MQVEPRRRNFELNPYDSVFDRFSEDEDDGWEINDFDGGFVDDEGRSWPWEYVEFLTRVGTLRLRRLMLCADNGESDDEKKERVLRETTLRDLLRASVVRFVETKRGAREPLEDDANDASAESEDGSVESEDFVTANLRLYGIRETHFSTGDTFVDSLMRLVLGFAHNGKSSCEDFGDLVFRLSMRMSNCENCEIFMPSFSFVANHFSTVTDWKCGYNAYQSMLFLARYRMYRNKSGDGLVDNDTPDRGFGRFAEARFGYAFSLMLYEEINRVFAVAYRGHSVADEYIARAHLRVLAYKFFISEQPPSPVEAWANFRKFLAFDNLTVAAFYARFVGKFNVALTLLSGESAECVRHELRLGLAEANSIAFVHIAVSMGFLAEIMHLVKIFGDVVDEYECSHRAAVATVSGFGDSLQDQALLRLNREYGCDYVLRKLGGMRNAKSAEYYRKCVSEIDASLRHLCCYDRRAWRRHVIWFRPIGRTVVESGVPTASSDTE